MIDFPSGRVLEKASRWDCRRAETCGGGKSVSGGSLVFGNIGEFTDVELRQEVPQGAHKLRGCPPSWGAPGELVTPS